MVTIQGLVVGSPLLVVGSPLRCACLMCVVCSSSVIFPTVSSIPVHLTIASAAQPRALRRDAPRAGLARAAAVDRRAQRLVHRERRAGAAS